MIQAYVARSLNSGKIVMHGKIYNAKMSLIQKIPKWQATINIIKENKESLTFKMGNQFSIYQSVSWQVKASCYSWNPLPSACRPLSSLHEHFQHIVYQFWLLQPNFPQQKPTVKF